MGSALRTLEMGPSFKQLLFFIGLTAAFPRPKEETGLDLTVIHINDIHAHFEQTSVDSTRCRPEHEEANECYGGVPRIITKVTEIRNQDPEALFLNAGDFYQGSIWYNQFKYEPMVEFGNLMNFTAMGVGNHDFDDSIVGLAPFAEKASYDFLAANIDNTVTDGSFSEGKHYKKSVVKNVKGKLIGIIGYITRSTSYNFPNGTLTFTDEIEAVRAEAKNLKQNNVSIIIALGHSGYEIDQELAANIPELDLVVGGHSHTFLYTDNGTGVLPSTEYPRGDYPTYVSNKETNKIIPVVQAYCYTKYLGYLKIRFDANGELLEPVNGNGVSFAQPILLDKTVEEDQTTLERMSPWKNNLTDYYVTVGENKIPLTMRAPSEEGNLGDVVCQSMAAIYDDTRISFSNNGGIRSDLVVGNLTYEDIMYVLPFENTVDLVQMTGKGLRDSIENAAARIDHVDVNQYPGFGYQLSGLKVRIEVSASNSGNRVTELQEVKEDGTLDDVEDEKVYNVALPSFLVGVFNKQQGQTRGTFDGSILNHTKGQVMIYEALRDYVEKNSPLEEEIDGRLTVVASNSS